jgi:hypothetical protein
VRSNRKAQVLDVEPLRQHEDVLLRYQVPHRTFDFDDEIERRPLAEATRLLHTSATA